MCPQENTETDDEKNIADKNARQQFSFMKPITLLMRRISTTNLLKMNKLS